MIAIGNTLVSDELIREKFVCDLNKCKGACCVEGVSGAPLENNELKILEDIYEDVKPYLTKEGIETLEKDGMYVKDTDGDFVTPLINGNGACAYTIYKNGIAQCGIEKAHSEKKINFQKPISCHLYPVRITKYKNYEAVNYHEWEICSHACQLGKKLKMPVYMFVKNSLLRKYGTTWFNQLKLAASKALEKQPL
ncbi:MAG: DUF3109 family protein [Bacteroidia bacterium]